jgi:hypothetical protein
MSNSHLYAIALHIYLFIDIQSRSMIIIHMRGKYQVAIDTKTRLHATTTFIYF